MSQMSEGRSTTYLGIIFMTITWILYAVMNALVKSTYQFAAPPVALFFQHFIPLLITAPLLLRGGVKALYSTRPRLLFLRALVGTSSFYCMFCALSHLPLTNCVVLQNTAPLFVPLISLIGWRKKSPWPIWAALALGFSGVLLVFPPQSQGFNAGTILGLLAGLTSGLAMFVLRALAQEPPLRIMFYFFLAGSLATFPLAAPHLSTLPLESLKYYVSLGSVFVIAQFVYMHSLRHCCPSISAPFSYSAVLGAGLIDLIVWNRFPSLSSAIGMLCVVAGGVTVLLQLRAAGKSKTPVADSAA